MMKMITKKILFSGILLAAMSVNAAEMSSKEQNSLFAIAMPQEAIGKIQPSGFLNALKDANGNAVVGKYKGDPLYMDSQGKLFMLTREGKLISLVETGDMPAIDPNGAVMNVPVTDQFGNPVNFPAGTTAVPFTAPNNAVGPVYPSGGTTMPKPVEPQRPVTTGGPMQNNATGPVWTPSSTTGPVYLPSKPVEPQRPITTGGPLGNNAVGPVYPAKPPVQAPVKPSDMYYSGAPTNPDVVQRGF